MNFHPLSICQLSLATVFILTEGGITGFTSGFLNPANGVLCLGLKLSTDDDSVPEIRNPL